MSQYITKLFNSLTHGVYVVGVVDSERVNAFTAASVMLVSFDPPQLALSVNVNHSSYKLLKASGTFTVNVLKRGQIDFAANYAKPASSEKMSFAAWRPCRNGAPLLQDAIAWFECKVTGELLAGDHNLILGRVLDGNVLDPLAEPMNYRDVQALDEDYAIEAFPDTLKDNAS